jgi:hypothetical protein
MKYSWCVYSLPKCESFRSFQCGLLDGDYLKGTLTQTNSYATRYEERPPDGSCGALEAQDTFRATGLDLRWPGKQKPGYPGRQGIPNGFAA